MNYRVGAISFECIIKSCGIEDVADNERTPLDDVCVPPRKVIERDGLQTLGS